MLTGRRRSALQQLSSSFKIGINYKKKPNRYCRLFSFNSSRSVADRRFAKVTIGEKVYCPDGTAHLVYSE
jgi:hypothetical protein